jgi:hypothetical protein
MDRRARAYESIKETTNGGRAALLPIDIIIYVSQLMVACSVLGFSGFMLHQGGGDCEKSSPYLGPVSFILGKLCRMSRRLD